MLMLHSRLTQSESQGWSRSIPIFFHSKGDIQGPSCGIIIGLAENSLMTIFSFQALKSVLLLANTFIPLQII